MPTAFIPDEDQGQVRGYFTLPDGASLERTEAVMNQIRAVVAEDPLIRTGNFYAGRSFGQSGENTGSFYLRLKPLRERPGGTNSSEAVKDRLNAALRQRIQDARVVVIEDGFDSLDHRTFLDVISTLEKREEAIVLTAVNEFDETDVVIHVK